MDVNTFYLVLIWNVVHLGCYIVTHVLVCKHQCLVLIRPDDTENETKNSALARIIFTCLTIPRPRFLVLCQYKMPGTFTVKAGFALPGQVSPDTGLADPGELEAVEPEYYDDFLPPGNNNNYEDFLLPGNKNKNNYDDFLASLSHNSIDSRVLASQDDHWASQRRSRTFSTNLFGSREVGGEGRSLGDGGDKGGHVRYQDGH